MNLYAHLALAIGAAALAACTSGRTVNERRSADIVAFSTSFPVGPVAPSPPLHSNFDVMRAALPAFYIERLTGQPYFAMIRDITFHANSALLSDVEVERLSPILDYLSEHPGVTVLIRGYGDRAIVEHSDAELGRSRADTIARALRVRMTVGNEISAIAGTASDASYSSADIQFSAP